MPARPSDGPPGAFGEIDLPHERPVSSAPPGPGAVNNSADFGDLELGDKPRSGRTGPSVVAHADAPSEEGGGLTFGEVDFGGSDASRSGRPGAIGVETSSANQGGGAGRAAATAPVSTSVRPGATARDRTAPEAGRRSYGKLIAGGVFIALILGGGALQLTSYGAFGYLAIGDAVHAGDYARATSAAMADAEKTLGADTYDAAKAAADAAFTSTFTPAAPVRSSVRAAR